MTDIYKYYGKFSLPNTTLATVADAERFRLAEYTMPTVENRRSTEADVAGHPRVLPGHHLHASYNMLLLL